MRTYGGDDNDDEEGVEDGPDSDGEGRHDVPQRPHPPKEPSYTECSHGPGLFGTSNGDSTSSRGKANGHLRMNLNLHTDHTCISLTRTGKHTRETYTRCETGRRGKENESV